MTILKRILLALLLALTLFINAHKPSDHEHLAESPTERLVPYVSGYDAIYTQYLGNVRQQAETARRVKRKQALEEAQKLYDAKIAEEQRKVMQQKRISRSNNVKLTQFTMIATHYTARCDGCSGITATGIDVTRTIYENGLRVIAVDPRVIPLGSIVRVEYADGTTFKAIAGDVGGAIKNRRIDVLVASENEAYRLGKQSVTVTILKNGKGR
ncbi:3D domain-containing protein [Lysinibacillus sp. NPDC097162]|uniref:3D domain-containing protein n=1 Tax=Lysinibacillus sp. NPDC097162 TaxID=3364140 RepID=UPI003807DD49